MRKLYGFFVTVPRKSVFFTMVNRSRFGMGPNMALSKDSDWVPPENVKTLISTLVRYYLSRVHLARVALCANRGDGLDLKRLTNLKTDFDSPSSFIRY